MLQYARKLRKFLWTTCYAKRLECVELAPAFEAPPPYDSASKLDALQTLRVVVRPQEPSQLTSILEHRSALQCGSAANYCA